MTPAPSDADQLLESFEFLVDLLAELDGRLDSLERTTAERPAWVDDLLAATRTPPAWAGELGRRLERLEATTGDRLERLEATTAAAAELLRRTETDLAGLRSGMARLEVEPAWAGELQGGVRAIEAGLDRLPDAESLAGVVGEHVEVLAELLDAEGARSAASLRAVVEALGAGPRAADAPTGAGTLAPPDAARVLGAVEAVAGELARARDDATELRADVRHAVADAERALHGELRALGQRLAHVGDDARTVRALRDALESVAADLQALHRTTSRTATAAQLGDVAVEIGAVLREVAAARPPGVGGARPAIDAREAPPADLGPGLARLEELVDDLAARLDATTPAPATTPAATAGPPASPSPAPAGARDGTPAGAADLDGDGTHGLRRVATSARWLTDGLRDDLRARRRSRRP